MWNISINHSWKSRVFDFDQYEEGASIEIWWIWLIAIWCIVEIFKKWNGFFYEYFNYEEGDFKNTMFSARKLGRSEWGTVVGLGS